jgi:WD40 repeat protein
MTVWDGSPDRLWIYRLSGGKATQTFAMSLPNQGDVACVSGDGRLVVTAHRGFESEETDDLTVRSSSTGKALFHVRSVPGTVRFTPDGSAIIGVSSSGVVTRLDLKAPNRAADAATLGWPLAVSPDGRWVATARDRTVRLLAPDTLTVQHELFGHTAPVGVLAFTRDGQILASASGSEIAVWDMQTFERLRSIPVEDDRPRSMAFTPDGTRLITSGSIQTFGYDARTGERLFEINASGDVGSVGGGVFNLLNQGGSLDRRDATSGALLKHFQNAWGPCVTGQGSTRGMTVATQWTSDTSAQAVVSVGTESRKMVSLTGFKPTSVSVCPDHDLFAFGDPERGVRVYRGTTCELASSMQGDSGDVLSPEWLAFSADGRFLYVKTGEKVKRVVVPSGS